MKTIAMLLLTALCLLSCGPGRERSCPPADTDIVLPADEAPHDNEMEWWYYTGHLWTGAGERYGFEFTIFQTFAAVGGGRQVGYAGHFAVSDAQRQQHYYAQKIIAPPEAFRSFRLEVGDWSIRGDGKKDWLRASMERFEIDLTCTSRKPVAFNGRRGVVDMGGGKTSFYYSKTRMDAVGTLTVDGRAEPVSGMAWSDHQWGDFDVFASDGWDWFSIQLDDYTELMIFLLHFADGQVSLTGGTFVDADGCHHNFTRCEAIAQGSWESPRTGTVYPQGWTLEVPEHDLVLDVQPSFADQEMDCRATTLNTYWEGQVEVSGKRRGRAVSGLGYVELAGYGCWMNEKC